MAWRSRVTREGNLDIADSLADLLYEWRVPKDRVEVLGEITKHSKGDTSNSIAKVKEKANKSKADGLCIRIFQYTTTGDPNSHYCVYGIMYKVKQST